MQPLEEPGRDLPDRPGGIVKVVSGVGVSPADASAWIVTVTVVFPGFATTIRGRAGSPAIAGSTTQSDAGACAPPVAPSSFPTPTLLNAATSEPSL